MALCADKTVAAESRTLTDGVKTDELTPTGVASVSKPSTFVVLSGVSYTHHKILYLILGYIHISDLQMMGKSAISKH